MATRTQALNLFMPNQWARSAINGYTDTSTKSINPNQSAQSAINVYTDTSTQFINAKPKGKISYQCLHEHKHIIDQRQINGCDQLSMSTQTQALDRSTPTQWGNQLSMSTRTTWI